jgi:hypothetical protein
MQQHDDSAMGDSTTASASAAAAASSSAAGESIAAVAASSLSPSAADSSNPQIASLERVLRLNADYQSFLHAQLGELQLLLMSNAEKRRLVEQIQSRSDAQHKQQAVVTRRAIFEAPFFVDQNGNVRKQRSAGQGSATQCRRAEANHLLSRRTHLGCSSRCVTADSAGQCRNTSQATTAGQQTTRSQVHHMYGAHR